MAYKVRKFNQDELKRNRGGIKNEEWWASAEALTDGQGILFHSQTPSSQSYASKCARVISDRTGREFVSRSIDGEVYIICLGPKPKK